MKFIVTRKLPYSTIVGIEPDEIGLFTKKTFIDCNSVKVYTEKEFESFYEKGIIRYKGNISRDIYNLIVKGISDSTMIAEEHKKDILS